MLFSGFLPRKKTFPFDIRRSGLRRRLGATGLRRGPLSGEAWRGSRGVRAGGRSPAWVAAVRSRLGETKPARRAYGGRYDGRRTRLPLRLLVSEPRPDRLPRRGNGRREAIRLRLRDSPRARRAWRGAF